MRKRSNENLCPRYPGRQWKQMFTFKGNKFDMGEVLKRGISKRGSLKRGISKRGNL